MKFCSPGWMICLSLLSMSSLPAIARVSQDAVQDTKPTTLVYRLKTGQTNRTKAVITLRVMGQDIQITAVEKSTVKELKPDGQVTVISETESRIIKAGETEQALPVEKPTTSVRDKYGKLLEWKADLPDGENADVARLMETIAFPLLPDKAVKTGESWETKLDNPSVKDKTITVKTTYAGKETVDGVEAWKIKQSADADTDSAGNPITVESTQWINPKNGEFLKVEAVVKNYPSPQGKTDLTLKAVHLGPNKETK